VGEAEEGGGQEAQVQGGKGLPDLYLFLGSRYTALHLTLATSPVNNKTQALAQFWLGSYLGTLRLTPVSFLLPTHYVQLQKLRHFKLEKESVTVLTKHRSLLSLVQEREPVSSVRACYKRAHNGLAQRGLSCSVEPAPGPVLDGRLCDPPGQGRYAHPGHGEDTHVPPSRLRPR
jgi:hypothetical protein